MFMHWGTGGAQIKDKIDSWETANKFLLAGRNKTSRKVAHETWVEALDGGKPSAGEYAKFVGLRHYRTIILVWRQDGVVINTSIASNTTRDRLNHFLPSGLRVFRKYGGLCFAWWDLQDGHWEAVWRQPVLFSGSRYMGEISSYRDGCHEVLGSPPPFYIFPRKLPNEKRTKKK